MAQLNANPLAMLSPSLGSTNPSTHLGSSLYLPVASNPFGASTFLTPGMFAADSRLPQSTHTLGGNLAGMLGGIGARIATPYALSALGISPLLSSGAGVASALGLGAGIGSIIPGIGTVAGMLAAAFLPNLFKRDAPAINDISAAQARGQSVTPAQWNTAGYGAGGTYLPAAQLLTSAPGQKSNAPLRDIADAMYNTPSEVISPQSWAQAGLPSGGGSYGSYLESAIGKIRGEAGMPMTLPKGGLNPSQEASLSSLGLG